MKSFVNTVVGGAIGLVALYVVGRIAYQAGRDVAMAEHRYEEACKKAAALESGHKGETGTPELNNATAMVVSKDEQLQTVTHRQDVYSEQVRTPIEKKCGPASKIGMMLGLRRFLNKKESVIGRLVHNPEAHRIEAFVEGDEIKLNVKPKTA